MKGDNAKRIMPLVTAGLETPPTLLFQLVNEFSETDAKRALVTAILTLDGFITQMHEDPQAAVQHLALRIEQLANEIEE